MGVSEKIKKLSGQLTGEGADAQKSLLNEILGEVESLLTAHESANNEAARRRKANEKYEAEVADLKEQIEKFNAINPELDRLKGVEVKYNAIKEEGFKAKSNDWQKKAEIFAIPETDKRYAKVQEAKADFHFPADDKSALSEEQLSANIKAFNIFDKAGYFNNPDGDKPTMTPRPADAPPKQGESRRSGEATWNPKWKTE